MKAEGEKKVDISPFRSKEKTVPGRNSDEENMNWRGSIRCVTISRNLVNIFAVKWKECEVEGWMKERKTEKLEPGEYENL